VRNKEMGSGVRCGSRSSTVPARGAGIVKSDDPPPATVRVAIQQRLRLLREGMRSLLEQADGCMVVGVAAEGARIAELLEPDGADVVVLEVDVLDWDPSRLAYRLQSRWPSLRFVGTHRHGGEDVEALRRSGISRMYSHEARAASLIQAIRQAAIDPTVPVRVLGAPPSLPGQLTERELQILQLIGAGRTSKEISRRMAITYKTVENHTQRIFGKLGVQNQAHAVSVAFRRGFITPEKVLQLAAQP
jgi:DNA-binding NarL/FixJ family response regulator